MERLPRQSGCCIDHVEFYVWPLSLGYCCDRRHELAPYCFGKAAKRKPHSTLGRQLQQVRWKAGQRYLVHVNKTQIDMA